MTEEFVIEYDRADIIKGEVLSWDFKYQNAFNVADVINAGNVTVTIDPPATVSPDTGITAASPVVSGLTVQVTFTTTNGIVGQEYEADVFATTDSGLKKHLFLILRVI